LGKNRTGIDARTFTLVTGDLAMFKLIKFLLSLLLTMALVSKPAFAQLSGVLQQQKSEFSPVEALSSQERDQLADPLFNLVLKDHADITNLSAIEDLIQPDKTKRETFVVDEKIADPSLGQSRRTVLTYSGRNGTELLNSNVMFSVNFNSSQFLDQQAIEAWGWDGKRGRYNYYKLDTQGTGSLSWKFRGSSDNADQLTLAQRNGTCVQCHINGAPVMKELLRPWNNWHSGDFPATYLQTSSVNPWPVASNSKIDGRLGDAYVLERLIVSPIRNFNRIKISKRLQLDNNGQPVNDTDGSQKVINGKTLLQPLFATTEYNIISADRPLSGLHPFPAITTNGPTENVKIPNSFFLNANLISGGTTLQYQGLGIRDSQTFDDLANLTADEYKNLVVQSQVKLGNRQPGDAVFAWLVPESSHIDNDLVDQLMRQGIITPEFVAAVTAIDLENPILSEKRRKLLDLIPNEFRFQPLSNTTNPLTTKRHPDSLTQTVINNLESLNPSSDSPEGEFLDILKNSDPRKILEDRVKDYRSRLAVNLNPSNPAVRQAELKRLYDLAITRRQLVLRDVTLSALNETGNLLFPVP
jgi:hypothetical protein